MKLYLCIYLFCGVLALSCQPQIAEKANYNAEFIARCIDSTLHLDPGTSTKTYLVDFGKVRGFSETSIRQFFTTHPNASQTNLDSMLNNDTLWRKEGYFVKCIIKFQRIEFRNDSIIVKTSKMRATDGSNGAEIIFKKSGSSYIFLYSGITWIS